MTVNFTLITIGLARFVGRQNRYATGYQMMVDFYKKVMGMEGCTINLEN